MALGESCGHPYIYTPQVSLLLLQSTIYKCHMITTLRVSPSSILHFFWGEVVKTNAKIIAFYQTSDSPTVVSGPGNLLKCKLLLHSSPVESGTLSVGPMSVHLLNNLCRWFWCSLQVENDCIRKTISFGQLQIWVLPITTIFIKFPDNYYLRICT